MYVFTPSSYWIRAMRAERFGSYSMATTVARTPSLRRLKSMMRYFCLWPPPTEARADDALVVAAALLGLGPSSDFSGFFLRSVMSEKSLTDPCRRPGVIGLYWRMAMAHLFSPSASGGVSPLSRDPSVSQRSGG